MCACGSPGTPQETPLQSRGVRQTGDDWWEPGATAPDLEGWGSLIAFAAVLREQDETVDVFGFRRCRITGRLVEWDSAAVRLRASE